MTEVHQLRGTAVRWWIACAVWGIGVAAGTNMLWSYRSTPGQGGLAPDKWPHDSRIERVAGRATLVMLAHPRCPCTRASLGELAWLMARFGDRLSAHVLFLKPAGTVAKWEQSDTWQQARAIPGVQVKTDDGGTEAALFGAATSGQAVLYDRDGRLLFAGGITGGRGHPGDNLGRMRVASLLTDGKADSAKSPVFGCDLADPKPRTGGKP